LRGSNFEIPEGFGQETFWPQDILDRVERGGHSGNIVGIKERVNEERIMIILANLLIFSLFSKQVKDNPEKR